MTAQTSEDDRPTGDGWPGSASPEASPSTGGTEATCGTDAVSGVMHPQDATPIPWIHRKRIQGDRAKSRFTTLDRKLVP
jgi:hypothetical protein